jgi:HEAT repeat protein
MKSDPDTVVPALAACLNDTNVALRFIAIRAIAEFGQEATVAIPALSKLAMDESNDSSLREAARIALTKIREENRRVGSGAGQSRL